MSKKILSGDTAAVKDLTTLSAVIAAGRRGMP
jgi:hypothetical protein